MDQFYPEEEMPSPPYPTQCRSMAQQISAELGMGNFDTALSIGQEHLQGHALNEQPCRAPSFWHEMREAVLCEDMISGPLPGNEELADYLGRQRRISQIHRFGTGLIKLFEPVNPSLLPPYDYM